MGGNLSFMTGLALVFAIISLFYAIVAVIGGIFAVQRKRWGWALSGSIAASFSFLPVGIPAVILVAISKKEFE